MTTLTTSYQKIGTSSTVSFGYAEAYLELWAKYNSQSIPDNTTNWSIETRLVVTRGYIGEYTGTTLTLNGDGISSSQSCGTGDFYSQTLGSASGTTSHNSDGTKSVNASSSIYFSAWGQSISVSGSATLPTIPRYATITSFSVSKRDETSVKYSFSTDATCDHAKYSTDNGSTWYDLPTTNIVSGLSPNTTYNFKIQLKRQDSQLWTTSGTVQQTTYNYPYCTSTPNFIIGNHLRLDFYNPLGRLITVKGYSSGNTEIFSGTTTGTYLSGFNDSVSVATQYSTIPNAKSGTYKVSVTYGSSTKTRNNGNTYTINESECIPTFTDFDYQDININTIAMTNNNKLLVDNYSECEFLMTNRATAKNSASIIDYVCYWGDNYVSYLENNMTLWTKTHRPITITYDSSTQMNRVVCTGVSGIWECLYFPIRTIVGKKYKLKFDYQNPNGYTPLSGYTGIRCQILTAINNNNNYSNEITGTFLNPTASASTQNIEIEFIATTTTTYINFNLGMAADNTTADIYLGKFELAISGGSSNTLKMIVTDSRGLSKTVTKTITNIPYVNSNITELNTQREDGVDERTYLIGKFNIYNGSWINDDTNENSMNRLKYVGYSVYTNNAWSEYYDITNEVLQEATTSVNNNIKTYEIGLNDEIELHANGSSGGFLIGTKYQIKVLIKDGNSSTIFIPTNYETISYTEITDGNVAFSLHQDSNSLYHFGINGMSDDNYMFKVKDKGIIDNDGILVKEIYSTTEKIIGKDEDNNYIYQKTLPLNLTNKSTNVQHNISNFGKIRKAYGSCTRTSGGHEQQIIPCTYSGWEIYLYDFTTTIFKIKFSDAQWDAGVTDVIITLEYTKTTD